MCINKEHMINNREISIIVAIGNNNEIGFKNNLLWRISDDLKRFKNLTTGNNIVMGRKTYESLPKGALPNRKNIVITRNTELNYENCAMANSLEQAIEKSDLETNIFIIGGEQIYKDAYKQCDYLYLTKVYESFEADAFFPMIDFSEWNVVETEKVEKSEKNEYAHEFFKLKRKQS